MLTSDATFRVVAEVNPPELPNMDHLLLANVWSDVLVTDNVFGRVRVSPYAFAARITHDVPSVHPTVVVSTRDRNILAIESEVRGALGNGVDSFLVVIGDTVPAVEHLAHHYEIVEHLRDLQGRMPPFEVGMATRFQRWQYQRRLDVGAQFFVAGPVIDPATVGPSLERLGREPGDPPFYLMVIPPFSPTWVEKMEGFGSVPVTDAFRRKLEGVPADGRRVWAWERGIEAATVAKREGCDGVILMGLAYETVVSEAALRWRPALAGLQAIRR